MNEIIPFWNKCDDVFKKEKVTIKSLNKDIETLVNNADKSTIIELLSTIFNKVNDIKDDTTAQVTNLINNFKLENNKDFESKFKHIINSVKNNYKIIIKQEDQVNNLETLLNSTPFVPPKSLAKERFPLPHFNKEKSFLPKHEECTVKCQKLYMQLSIDHLNESIEATKKLNLDIKNQLDPEFKDLLYLKSTFKLECIDIDGFFDEMKSQAAKLVQAELLREYSEMAIFF